MSVCSDNVAPRSAVNNVGNGRPSHSEFLCQPEDLCALFVEAPNGSHKFRRQFGVTVRLPPLGATPISHAGHVVGVGSERKVRWVDANRAVARVQHEKTTGLALMQFMADDVCALGPSANVELSVAVAVKRTKPRPALSRRTLGRVHPKALFYGGGFLTNTGARAKHRLTARARHFKRFPACLTSELRSSLGRLSGATLRAVDTNADCEPRLQHKHRGIALFALALDAGHRDAACHLFGLSVNA
jgi:hypothetical protein